MTRFIASGLPQTPIDVKACLTGCKQGGIHRAARARSNRAFCFRWTDPGECPEWQRGGTVNPLLYGFVGSSPTSPTISML
jgi:hypothetical protein